MSTISSKDEPDGTVTNERIVLPLNACTLTDNPLVGGKAVGLGRLIAGGLPVPDGFAVTTAAYRDALARTGLDAEIDTRLARLAEDGDAESAARDVRRIFDRLTLPSAITDAIADAYAALGADTPVAVRSSATAEDTDAASFAGQQDTYLWIRGIDAVIAHVKSCWASLFTERAIGYRAKFDFDVPDLAMGVVVQTMVPASAAGVMMSLHPVTGDPSEIYIESSLGLGEAVVRGDVDPDQIVLDRKSLRILSIEIGSKELAHRFDPAAGEVVAQQTTDAERRQLSVTPESVKELGRLCDMVAARFGADVDIEWAVADDKVYLLQARPETVWSRNSTDGRVDPNTLTDQLTGPDESRSYWTTVNAAEAIQGVPSPLTYSWYNVAGELGLRHCFADLGVLPMSAVALPDNADERFISICLGRVVINVDSWRHAGDLLPGSSGNAIEEQFFGAVRPGIESHSTARRYPVVAVKFPVSMYAKKRRIEQARREYETWWRDSIRRLSSDDVDLARRLLAESFDRFNNIMRHHVAGSMISQAFYERLAALCDSVGKEGLEQVLTTGYGSMEESAVLAELWRAARAGEDVTPLTQRFGYYGSNSGEISTVCWREDPSPVIALADGYRSLADDKSPHALADRQHAKRLAAEAELLDALSAPMRPVARLIMKVAAAYLPLRESGRAALLMATDVGRASARVIGRDLERRGVVESADDIMYHTHDEILERRFSMAQVAHRRRRAERYERLELPESWQGVPTPIVGGSDDDEGDVIKGLSANGGVVEGRARVVMSSGEMIEPGDILVCKTTDPTWASLMLLASAVVVDIGGALSHGAIVARELGIPCVVNTKTGTKRLSDGDTIRVDGGTGVVERIVHAPAVEAPQAEPVER